MKVGILLFEQFYGKRDIGSSRIRGHWLCKYWNEAEPFKIGQKYDVIIYQKVYWLEYAAKRKRVNEKVIQILDICDADWLHWGHRVKQMIDICDAVTTSSVELAKFISQMTDKPVWCIPDRLDLEQFKQAPKKHIGPITTAAWFGYSENFRMLDAAITGLIREKVKNLIVIASRRQPYSVPPSMQGKINLTNYPWTAETVHSDLLKADVVINPQTTHGRFKYKSNNKTILAWALGLPVAHDDVELKRFMDPNERQSEAAVRLEELRKDYDINKSVAEFKELIKTLEAGKENKDAEISKV